MERGRSNKIEPRHTPDESTIVFDTHPCAHQGAQRVYGTASFPTVCSSNDYADIYDAAVHELNYPTCYCCCFFAPTSPPSHETFLTTLQKQYSYLDLQLTSHVRGYRYIYVLAIRKKQGAVAVMPDMEVPTREALPPALPAPLVGVVVGQQTMEERK